MAFTLIGIGATPNDGTGDPIRTAYTKVNTLINALNNFTFVGVYDYNNTLSVQSFTGTPIVLNNNGAGANTNKTYKLQGIDDIFNTTTNEFTFNSLTLGDVFNIRVNLTITTSGANQEVDIYMNLAIGTGSNYQVSLGKRFFKTSGVHTISDIYNFIYMGNTDTKNNPAKIMFNSDANATVLVNGFSCVVNKRIL
jgi:hypothetical protein